MSVFSPLRVLHVIPTLDPSRGGPSRSVLGLAEAQAAQGESVTIVTGTTPGCVQPEAERVDVQTAPLLAMPFSIPGRRLTQQLRRAISSADIVHLHSVWNGTTTKAAWMCRQFGKPIVLSPRGMLDRHNMQRRAYFKKMYLFGLERANLEAVAGFHFLDDTEYEGCDWLRHVRDVPHVIQPNGLDLEKLHARLAGLSSWRISHGAAEGQSQNLVFLGRLNVIKGLDMQLEMLSDMRAHGKQVHLHLIGPDDGEGSRILSLASALGIAPYVHHHGAIYGDDRLCWLQTADAVLLTSHYECNSNTAAETLAVGGVLVAADTCHLDCAARARAARVVPRDRQRLSASLLEVLSSSKLSATLRQRAMEFARSSLDWKPLASQMLDFYRMLVGTAKSCAG